MQAAANLTNESGLDGDRHDTDGTARTMWHTAVGPSPTAPAVGLPAFPAWVKFDFAQPVSFSEIQVWNHNQSSLTNRGFRKTRVYGTTNGSAWNFLAEAELKQGGDTAQSMLVRSAAPLKSVILAAESNWGGDVLGLSEVRFIWEKQVAADAVPLPAGFTCEPKDIYRHRADGKPGREIAINFTGGRLYAPAELLVECDGKTESTVVPASPSGIARLSAILPAGAGVDRPCDAKITLRANGGSISRSLAVPAKRQWTVFLYPHSHVDIGYTQPQDIVEKINTRNMRTARDIIRESDTHPDGAKYVWNAEVVWAAENFLRVASPEDKSWFNHAVKTGRVGIDASFGHLNTSACADEELLRYFQGGMKLRQLTGAPINTMVQIDVPGASWGLVQAAAQAGVRGVIDFPNGFDRIGGIHTHYQRPFWWVAPDGKSRVLYIQGPRYDLGWGWKATQIRPNPYPHFENPSPGWVQDYPAVVDRIRTSNPAQFFIPLDFILNETANLERDGLPYDYFTMTWSMSDNSIPDADLPDAVKDWNSRYAYPKLVIASAQQIVDAYIGKFGGIIPERRGDITEYWTDGLGSDALRVGYNRLAKERLIQTETLQSMLGTHADQGTFTSAAYASWRWILLGSEHTWGYWQPERPIAKQIEAVKASYFENGKATSEKLLAHTLPPATPSSKAITVYNTLSWARGGLVTLPDGIAALKGTPTQRLSSGETVFLATDVPPLGSKVYQTRSSDPSNRTDLVVTPTTLDNGIVKVTLDPATGDIASLISGGSEFVNGALNTYRYLRGADPAEKATGPTQVKISIKEIGPVLASLRVESQAEGCKTLVREVRVLAGRPQVEIINVVDKIATRQKEGVHFGFAFQVPEGSIRMDIPWGVMDPMTDQLPGSNKNWLAFQRWIDISNATHGVTWTAIEAPLVQVGGITATILGGANDPKFWRKTIEPTQTLWSWALNNHWHTNFPLEQGGKIPFRYAVLPHGAFDPAAANRFGMEQNRPLLAVAADKPAPLARVAIDNPRVFLSTLKPAEHISGAHVIRLRSLSDKPEAVNLTFPAGAPKEILSCAADEVPGAPATATFTLPPYGAKSIILR